MLVLTAVLYFVRIGARALWASEFRWAEIAREMLLSHNYFWPTINGRVYFDKPLGSYWLVLAATLVTGGVDETATRIPSAIAGFLAIVLLLLLARCLYDLRTGIVAGFILATCFSFVFWARTASADVETVAGELAALLIFIKYESRPGWWVVAMWLVMALASLMKGLLGFVLPLLVIGIYSCLADGWPEAERGLMNGPLSRRFDWLIERNRWFFNWRTSAAVVLAATMYLAPFAISFAVTGSAHGIYMVYRENVERYFAPFDHRGPIYLYLYMIFELLAPWSVFLPAALAQAHTSTEATPSRPLKKPSQPAPPPVISPGSGGELKEGSQLLQGVEAEWPIKTPPASPQHPASVFRSDRFSLAFFWTIFIFFTLSGSRRSYYLLPILPAASILIARVFVVAERELGEAARLLLKAGFALIVLILILSLVVLVPPRILLPPPYSLLPMLPEPGIFIAYWIVSLGTAAYAWIRYSRGRVLLSMSVISYLLLSYLFIFALPAGERWRGEKRFAQMTRQLIDGHSDELAAFRTQPPVFYLGLSEPVPEFDTVAGLQSAVRGSRIRWLIVRRRDVSGLGVPGRAATIEPIFPWDSPEHRGNTLVLIRLER